MTAAAIKIKALWCSRPAWLNAGNAFSAALPLCLAYAFCRGFDMPNIWSTNYWLINFFDGFGRRALLGTLLYPFGEWRNHYHFIAAIQISTSAILLALVVVRLAAWLRQNTKNHTLIYIYICSFFLSWPGAFFFAITGYVENAHYLTIFLALLAPNGAVRVLLASSTVWMHESAAFTCLPLYFVIEWLHFERRREALAALALSLAYFIIIYIFFQTVDASVTEAYETGFLAHANYEPRLEYLTVFNEQFTGKRFRLPPYYGGVARSYAACCLMLASILAQGCVAPHKKWLAAMMPATLVFMAAAAPLAMGFFAWDNNRWVFLSTVNASTLFVLFQGRMNARWRLGFIGASLFFFFISIAGLFDDKNYRNVHEFMPFLGSLGTLVTDIPAK